jgi:3-dehydroquinate dehydratase-1
VYYLSGDILMKKVSIKDIVIGEGSPKICVPLIGRDEAELETQLEKILAAGSREKRIDIVEFRGDFFQGLDDRQRLRLLLEGFKKKLSGTVLLFTIRSETEGGERLGFSSPAVNDINEFVIENALADMVDVELMSGDERCRELCSLAKEKGVKIIMSNHDFKTTPPKGEIVRRLEKMEHLGADIAKIAVMPEDKRQLATLLDATLIMQEKDGDIPVVTMAMGRLGAISRLTGEIFGSAITFASVEKSSAPGQIPYDVMVKAIEIISDYCVAAR